jgi:AraC-like DNA-binding protein
VETLALTRISNVLPCVRELQAARLRMDHELRCRSLPTMLEEESDGFIPKVPLFDCLHAVAQQACLRDLGYAAFRRWRLSCLDRDVLARVRGGSTLAERLNTFAEIGCIEDTQLDVSLRVQGPVTRIVLSQSEDAFKGLEYSEWTQIAAALAIVRDAAGPRVQPLQLTLQARYRPCAEAYTEFRDAVIVGAPQTSIVIPTNLLGAKLAPAAVDSLAVERTEQVLSELSSGRMAPRFKLVLRSYLKDGYPPIGLAAELARTSVRSLQRELAQSGVSYSDLVQHVRFEQATRLLTQDRTKVIDVALSLGYEDASHFSRAFKRITGVSPRQFRTQSAAA